MEPILKWISVLVFSATVFYGARIVTELGLWNGVIDGLLIWMVAGSLLLASLAYGSWRVMLAHQDEDPVILKPDGSYWNRNHSNASTQATPFREAA